MSKMYIANCTNQVQDFHYRLPENRKLLKQPIGIGQQIRIPGDLSTLDIEAIVEQHTRYGLVSVAEIDRSRAFNGTCYQLDKPVDMEKVRRALEHNHTILDARGVKIRQEAAVSINNRLEEDLNPRQGKLASLEVEVVEDDHKDGTDTKINERTRVDRAAPPGGSPGRGARASRRAA